LHLVCADLPGERSGDGREGLNQFSNFVPRGASAQWRPCLRPPEPAVRCASIEQEED
jgi:hypothetical protein